MKYFGIKDTLEIKLYDFLFATLSAVINTKTGTDNIANDDSFSKFWRHKI